MHLADLTTVLAGIIYSTRLGIWSKPLPPMSAWAGDVLNAAPGCVLDPDERFIGDDIGEAEAEGSSSGNDGNSADDDGDGDFV